MIAERPNDCPLGSAYRAVLLVNEMHLGPKESGLPHAAVIASCKCNGPMAMDAKLDLVGGLEIYNLPHGSFVSLFVNGLRGEVEE